MEALINTNAVVCGNVRYSDEQFYDFKYILDRQYKSHLSKQGSCLSLGCSLSTTCRRCFNYIFILNLTPGFNWLKKDYCKTRRKFRDLVRFMLNILRQLSFAGITLLNIVVEFDQPLTRNFHFWHGHLASGAIYTKKSQSNILLYKIEKDKAWMSNCITLICVHMVGWLAMPLTWC